MLATSKAWMAVVLAAVLVATACAPAAAPNPTAAPRQEPTPALKPTPAPAPTAAPATEQPRYGGILTQDMSGDPPSLDIHQETTFMTLAPVGPAYNGLLQYDPIEQDKVVPDLAEKWSASPDGLVYSFYLRKNAKWHDGKPFTAEDARYNLERILHPPKGMNSPRAEVFPMVDKIEKADDYTLKITLKYRSASFLNILANAWIQMLPKHVIEEKGDMKKVVVGTGPFKFKDYNRGVSLELVKNPDYFLKDRPYLDGIITYVIKDQGAIFAALRTKRILLKYREVAPTEAAILKEKVPEIVYQERPGMIFPTYAMNLKRKPFDDARVRRAVSLAINRQAGIQVVGEGKGVIGGPMPPFTIYALSEAELAQYPGYGPNMEARLAEAKKLMAEAGYPNGVKGLKHVVRGAVGHAELAVFLKDQLAKVGIEINLVILESAAAYSATINGDFDSYSWKRLAALDDPDVVFGELYITGSPRNYEGYSNPKLDELYQKQARTLDAAQRKEMVREMQKILLEDNPKLQVFYAMQSAAFWPEVKGFQVPTNDYENKKRQDIWLAR